MAASTVYPQAFPEIVSIGQSHDSIGQILQKFQPRLNYGITIVDAQQQPIGIIRLPLLLEYIQNQAAPQLTAQALYPSLIEPLPIEPDRSLATPTDTTAEALAAQNINLTQLNRLKDEFLACVTHELRSPLTAILGLSTLLKDQSLGSLNPQQLRYAQLIYNSGRHLISIVNDMLDLTRIETNQLSLNLSKVNISQVCLSAFEQARQLRHLEDKHPARSSTGEQTTLRQHVDLEETNLPAFKLEIEPKLKSLIADEGRMQQMLMNLLSNAMKFTENSGNIGLKVSNWEGWIAFTVWDTGIGIPLDKQHLLFQKFQQVESPMTRQFEGAGLGLVLTQRLARLHGGDITFTSQEHHGSQFTLLLPPQPPQWHLPETAPSTNQRSTPRIATHGETAHLALVAESSPYSLEDLQSHLSELGYRVAVARTGPEALAKSRQLKPTVILMNPLLPTLSGWDVLTLLKADTTTQDIPVILTGPTADRPQTDMQKADALLTLPIIHRALEDALVELQQRTEHTTAHAEKPSVVLYLSPAETNLTSYHNRKLNQLLHQHNFRVIESHDLEQAELLAQVWRAKVIVLHQPNTADPNIYLKEFLQHDYLTSLPIITLDKATTQAANQLTNLAIFPCLSEWQEVENTSPIGLTDKLLQAVEVAIRFAGQPLILATNIEQWHSQPKSARHNWLNATAQYIQAAGLRCIVGRSRDEIMQMLRSEHVDLLLLHWQNEQTSLQTVLKILKQLKQEQQPFPEIILIRTSKTPTQLSATVQRKLQHLNITITTAQDSMDELLQNIRQTMGIAN